MDTMTEVSLLEHKQGVRGVNSAGNSSDHQTHLARLS